MEHRLRDAMAEQEKKLEARTHQIVAAERENLLNQLHHFIPNFDPTMLKPLPIQPQEQSPKNPMSDKASCSGALDAKALNYEEENEDAAQKEDAAQQQDEEKVT